MPASALNRWIIVIGTILCPNVFGQGLVPHAELALLNYYEFWEVNLPLQASETLREVRFLDDTVYAISDRSTLYAVRADLGTLRWAARLGAVGTRVFAPTHVRSFWGRDLALVSTSDHLEWLDHDTGQSVAKLDVPYIPTSSAASDGVRVYVGALDGLLYAYEFFPFNGSADIRVMWRVKTGGAISATPVLWGQDLFVASRDGRIRVGDAVDRSFRWVFRSGGALSQDIFVDGTGVYFACDDHCVYKVNTQTGAASWRFRTPAIAQGPPIIQGDRVYQIVVGHGVYAIDSDAGVELWHVPDAVEYISATLDTLHFMAADGDLLAVGAADGAIQERIYGGDARLVARNPTGQAMFLAGRRGLVMCAQDQRIPYLRFGEIEAGRRRTEVPEATSEEPGTPPTDSPTLRDLLSGSDTKPLLGD